MPELLIPANFFYPDLPGGSLQYFRYAPYLRERGVNLTVFTPRRAHHPESELEIAAIRVHRLNLPENQDALTQLMALIDAARREAKPGHSVIQPIGTFANHVASLRQLGAIRLAGIPVTRHFTQVPKLHEPPGLRRIREKLRYRLAIAPYSRLIMCSHEMGRAFQRVSGISSRRIVVPPNGIDQSVFHPPSDAAEKLALRKTLGLPETAPLILSVCSVIPRKGVDLLVAAWEKVLARHPAAHLVVVGSKTVRPTVGEADARATIADYLAGIDASIGKLSYPNRVILTGEVSNAQDYYRAADAFAFASLQEGLPSAVLEAMSSGLPAVLASFHGFPAPSEEYGTPEVHHLSATHDPASLAAGMVRLLDDAALREKIGQAASRWIAGTQGMDRAADLLADMYRGLCR